MPIGVDEGVDPGDDVERTVVPRQGRHRPMVQVGRGDPRLRDCQQRLGRVDARTIAPARLYSAKADPAPHPMSRTRAPSVMPPLVESWAYTRANNGSIRYAQSAARASHALPASCHAIAPPPGWIIREPEGDPGFPAVAAASISRRRDKHKVSAPTWPPAVVRNGLRKRKRYADRGTALAD